MRSQEINLNTLLSSKMLRGWKVNDKIDIDLSKNPFFFHLTSSYFKSELLHILNCFSHSFCSAFILLFCSCLICKMISIAAASDILPTGLRACFCKLSCIYCVKQLTEYLYCICWIHSGRIFYSHC